MAEQVPRPWIPNPAFVAMARGHAEAACVEHCVDRTDPRPCDEHLEQALVDLGEQWHRQQDRHREANR